VKIRATPHDVMSYVRCDEVRSITYDQVRRVRQTVYETGAWNATISEWTGGRSYLLQ
jgi:hypothetical protein